MSLRSLITIVFGLLFVSILITSFGLSIHNIIKLKELRDNVIIPSQYDKSEHITVDKAFNTLENDPNFVNQINSMRVVSGYNEHIGHVLHFVNEHLSEFEVTIINNDGRVLFDSRQGQDIHTGSHVFRSQVLFDASFEKNGEIETQIKELAIENHGSRPEIQAALRYPDIRLSTRQSSTSGKNSYYFAKRYDHVVLRLVKEE